MAAPALLTAAVLAEVPYWDDGVSPRWRSRNSTCLALNSGNARTVQKR
jgi:hypothetical protein